MKHILLSAALCLAATGAMAQHAHQQSPITETGQSQFAAISEIVAALRANHMTDWAKVDIDALRAHLVDMDNVTTKAEVARSSGPLSMTFTVTGDANVAPSIQRMLLAHSPMLEQETGWSVAAKATAQGATMEIHVASQDELTQIKALGIFGIMTIGAHHQEHHMLIATGQSPH